MKGIDRITAQWRLKGWLGLFAVAVCLILVVGGAAFILDRTIFAPARSDRAAPNKQQGLPRMPWALATVWFDLPANDNFRSLSADVTVKKAPRPDQHLYLATPGQGTLNGVTYYFGIQSGSNTPTGPDRIGIFARWDEQSPEAIRAAPGSFTEIGAYEGKFVSVRHRVPWHEGRWLARLVTGESTPQGTWVEATISDLSTGAVYPLGALRFPGQTLKFGGSIASFVEAFGPAITPEQIPTAEVVIGPMAINGAVTVPKHALARFEAAVPARTVVIQQAGGQVEVDANDGKMRPDLPKDNTGRLYQDFYWR